MLLDRRAVGGEGWRRANLGDKLVSSGVDSVTKLSHRNPAIQVPEDQFRNLDYLIIERTPVMVQTNRRRDEGTV